MVDGIIYIWWNIFDADFRTFSLASKQKREREMGQKNDTTVRINSFVINLVPSNVNIVVVEKGRKREEIERM